jgi:FkbM family methyltransferase
MRKLRRWVYDALLFTLRAFGPHRFFGSALVNRLLWDTAPRGTLLLSSGSEPFVISRGDDTIGRAVYLTRLPFDFDKLERVAGLLQERRLSVLIDIGANIGTICIPAVRRGYFSKAIAIEPEPLNFSLLMANIAMNGVAGRISTHNVALGDRDDQQLLFELSKTNFGDHRPIYGEAPEAGREVIKVKSQTLDSLVRVEPGTTLVWMDTQGFEGHVLAGATAILQSRPPLVTEFWPAALKRSGGLARFSQALVDAGYTSVRDLNDPNDKTLVFTPEALDRLVERLSGPESQTDLLLL